MRVECPDQLLPAVDVICPDEGRAEFVCLAGDLPHQICGFDRASEDEALAALQVHTDPQRQRRQVLEVLFESEHCAEDTTGARSGVMVPAPSVVLRTGRVGVCTENRRFQRLSVSITTTRASL